MPGFSRKHAFMGCRTASVALGAAFLVAAGSASAQDRRGNDAEAPRVEVLQQLYNCREIADPTERLACYDRQVGALQTAETSRDIRIVDREQVRQTRRGLFGLSLPDVGSIFGGGNDGEEDSDAVNELTATLSNVARNSSGQWIYTLDNGQVWEQTDSSAPGRSPRAGHSVVVRRASLGSFMISVEGRAGVRVRRVR